MPIFDKNKEVIKSSKAKTGGVEKTIAKKDNDDIYPTNCKDKKEPNKKNNNCNLS